MRPASGSLRPSRPAESWARIGMLTPSSNTVLEPYTAAMLASFGDDASAHFARFRVTEISMSDTSRTQFVDGPILEAARQLSDARVDVIAWNGTSASWLGFAKDEALCSAISDATGIAATSTPPRPCQTSPDVRPGRLPDTEPAENAVKGGIRGGSSHFGVDLPKDVLQLHGAAAGRTVLLITGQRRLAARPSSSVTYVLKRLP